MLSRLNVPTEATAQGLLTPIMRVSTHLGYCIRTAEKATDEDWVTTVTDIKTDLRETLNHLASLTPANAFVSPGAVEMLGAVIARLQTINDAPTWVRTEAPNNLAVLAHDFAYVVTMLENDLLGNNATEGTGI